MTRAGQSSRLRPALPLLLFMLFFYRLGASNSEGLLNYPFWGDMGRMMSYENFIWLRTEHLWKIFPLLVAPFGLVIVVTAILAWLTGAAGAQVGLHRRAGLPAGQCGLDRLHPDPDPEPAQPDRF